jgi:integrase
MARILVLTGQRLGSVEAMKWSDLDLDAAIWTIPGSDMKMGKDHVVALAPRAAEILRALPRASEYVFAGRDGERRNGRSRFRQSWVKASGVENWSPHDLRRVIASGMARLGVALHVVELILDHRARSMRGVAAVYQRHSFADEQRHALEAWAAHVEALVSGDAAAGNVVRLR